MKLKYHLDDDNNELIVAKGWLPDPTWAEHKFYLIKIKYMKSLFSIIIQH